MIKSPYRIPHDSEVIMGEEAKAYAGRNDNRSAHTEWFASKIVKIASSTTNIYEACCGAGQFAGALQRKSGIVSLVATDGSDLLISTARQNYGHLPITFVVENVHEKSYWDGWADTVICKDSFHHFHNPYKSIIDLLERAKSQGKLIIYDLCRNVSEQTFKKRLDSISLRHEKERFAESVNASLRVDEMIKICKSIGVKLESVEFPIKYESELIGKGADFECPDLSAIYVIRRL